jgi:hypothetical protein
MAASFTILFPIYRKTALVPDALKIKMLLLLYALIKSAVSAGTPFKSTFLPDAQKAFMTLTCYITSTLRPLHAFKRLFSKFALVGKIEDF